MLPYIVLSIGLTYHEVSNLPKYSFFQVYLKRLQLGRSLASYIIFENHSVQWQRVVVICGKGKRHLSPWEDLNFMTKIYPPNGEWWHASFSTSLRTFGQLFHWLQQKLFKFCKRFFWFVFVTVRLQIEAKHVFAMRNLSPFRSKDLLTLSPCLHFMVNICQFLRPIPNLTQTRSIISASLLLAFNFPFAISTPKFKWELCKIYIYIYIYIYMYAIDQAWD